MKEYHEYIKIEVYGGNELSVWNKIQYKYFIPSTSAVYLIRRMQLFSRIERANRFIKSKIARFKKNMIYRKLAIKYGIFINPDLEIGIGLKLPHPNGIIIGARKIGNNVTIYQQVTIGSAHIGDYLAVGGMKQPLIGDNVVFFSGAKILGAIEIANNVQIGANAVLTKSADAFSTYAGVPAHKIST